MVEDVTVRERKLTELVKILRPYPNGVIPIGITQGMKGEVDALKKLLIECGFDYIALNDK